MQMREKIIEAALRRLNEDPAASMADLAEAAGISRATLHRHFAGRDELIDEIGTQALDRWEAALDSTGVDAAAASADPDVHLATVRALLEVFADLAHEHGWSITFAPAESRARLQERSDRLEEREMRLYTAAQRSGVLRPDLPVRWVSNCVYGLCVTARESLRRGDVAPRDVARLMAETFLTGAGARP
ncbi:MULTISPECIES: TetR/AcrR family transcriptional regulator [Actinomadura]|uniref:TetR/AcrR family transcriptional regulator n=1 Tax=Actinomadura TaxID=1988 RepID=UPI0004214E62|nr:MULTISPECIES: TetR/AcrR family transcriptional regulator [Actinomadura]RSN68310.1 TetR/AcrR family transcriptional regulator [Actinomadura sp. WAC 06369]